MQLDSEPEWRKMGEQLEGFPPNNDHKTLSEWLIIRYMIRILIQKKQNQDNSQSNTESA